MASTAALGRLLDLVDVRGDVLGRPRGLVRQLLHLGGHHGEALAGLAGARRLDGGVERQQVGLARDGVDEGDDLADLLRAVRQRLHELVGLARILHGAGGGSRGLRHLGADLVGRCGEFLRRGGHRLHVAGGLLGRSRHRVRLLVRLLGGRGHRAGRGLHLLGRDGEMLDEAAHAALEVLGERHHLEPAALGGLLFGFGLLAPQLSASCMAPAKTCVAFQMSPISSLPAFAFGRW